MATTSNRDQLRARPNPLSALSIINQAIGDEPVPSQLVPLGNGDVQLGSFILTPKGLVMQGETSEPEWDEVGKVLRRLEGSIQWLIGDWFLVAETRWGKTYEAVALATSYKEKTLREYAYVARNVDLSIRMDNLTFGHHQLVAGMDRATQHEWLQWAGDNRVSISQMRASIAEANGEVSPTLPSYIPGEVIEAQPRVHRRFTRIESFVKGNLHLTKSDLMQDGKAIIEWVQRVMEAGE